MSRLNTIFALIALATTAYGQSAVSDPQALSMAAGSIVAMARGAVLSDVTLSGNAIYIAGADQDSGPVTLMASGTAQSRLDLMLSSGERIETRSASSGLPIGAWSNPSSSGKFASHNCLTDAVWFFPVLSSLVNTANQNYIFKYVGSETWNGLSVQHLHVYQAGALSDTQRLSAMDFYLDPYSLLPLGIEYNIHPDNNLGVDIPVQVLFANYVSMSGVIVPQRIQRLVNGLVTLDLTVTSANVNTGIPSSSFNLQ